MKRQEKEEKLKKCIRKAVLVLVLFLGSVWFLNSFAVAKKGGERAWNKNNKIIFAKHQYQRVPQIWVINSDGTNPQCILDPEKGGIPTAIYDDPVWDNSGTKVAVTKIILSDESWQVAIFPWEE